MRWLELAWRSLRHRRASTILTMASIALSTALLIGVEQMRTGMRESFSGTISRTDLIVGARGGQLQLLLATVFGVGATFHGIDYSTFERYSEHEAVAWTVPLALGDSHRGFRVVATNQAFFAHYRYRRDRTVELASGRIPAASHEIAIGHRVAAALGYEIGERIVVSHGLEAAPGLAEHDDHPFEVVGTLARTSTPIDRALFVTLEGMSAMHPHEHHLEESHDEPPSAEETHAGEHHHSEHHHPEQHHPEQHDSEQHHSEQHHLEQHHSEQHHSEHHSPEAHHEAVAAAPVSLTAFFVGTRSRLDALALKREIDQDHREPLMAILPGVAISELWRRLQIIEGGLRILLIFVICTAFLGLLVALYASLEGRRREMAILRAVGAKPRQILGLLLAEAFLLSLAGCALGLLLIYAVLVVAQPLIEGSTGFLIPLRPPSRFELACLAALVATGPIVSLMPAWRACRQALVDGLAARI